MSDELSGILDLRMSWNRVKDDIFKFKRVFIKHPYEIDLIERDLDGWLDLLSKDIKNGTYSPKEMYVCDVPKAKGLVRPGSHLSLCDRVIYSACVGACFPEISNALAWSQGTVDFSYQISSDPQSRRWFRNLFVGWQDFRIKSLQQIDSGVSYVIIADIAGYYENIDISTLMSDLKQIKAPVEPINQLSTCLNRWAQIPGRGIPQGQSASDILGKLYLNTVDQILKDMGYTHYRYVDDIRIFCHNLVEAKKALVELVRLFRKRGLNLQTAKTDIHRSAEAREILEGLTGFIKVIRRKFIDDIIDSLGLDDPYISMSDAETQLAQNPDEAPIEIIREAYEANFINSDGVNFDKTLFRFLLKRLGNYMDKFAVDHCKTLFKNHPEETHTILDYFKSCDVFSEVEDSIVQFLNSADSVYAYQTYQIIEWVSLLPDKPSSTLMAIARRMAFDRSRPYYLRFVCMKILGDYGTVGDLERLQDNYSKAISSLEQCEVMCCLARMEKGRRNAFLARVGLDGELNRRAADFVRNIRF